MRRLRTSLILVVGLMLATSSSVGATSLAKPMSHVATKYTGPTVDTSVALVQLNGDPLSTYVKTKPAQGKKISQSNTAVKSYRAQLSALRNDFKQWLQANAPKAKITGSWDLSLNAVSVQLNGTTLAKLATAPQVKHVEYDGLYHPDTVPTDPDLALVHGVQAWAAVGGAPNAGAGVKVAIVDTGIDIQNPCFDDSGYSAPAGFPKGDPNYTNNKVIVAKVFNKITSHAYTAEPIQEHGTHVAGTVACNAGTAATYHGATIDAGVSGVAPAAFLGSYVVFPGDVTNARSEDILNALEAAYWDGMDVANMSLGGGAAGIQDLLTMAVNDLDLANMVVAVAAGNSGDGSAAGDHPFFPPGHFTVESPGSAARALTAGAFSVGHTVASLVEQAANKYGTQDGDFAFPTTDLTATGVASTGGGAVVVSGDAGNPLNGHDDGCGTYSAPINGEIAVVGRGECTFAAKVHNAQAAGAVGVIIVNRDPEPIPMADDPTLGNTIPAVMVGLADGIALYGTLPTAVTITAPIYMSLYNAYAAYAPAQYIQADFSSQGPTDVDFRVKPDVMAPGVNVVSSVPNAFCDTPPCFDFFQGTSMATPHLAGGAAVVLGAHPGWSAWEVRSAIVNTADQGNVIEPDGSGVVTDVNITGAGSENVLSAVHAWVALDPVSVSFGAVPSGSGATLSYVVTIKNETGGSHTFDLSVDPGTGGVHYSLGSASILLASGETGTFTVWMTADKGAAFGGHQAFIHVSGSTVEYAHAAVYTLIK